MIRFATVGTGWIVGEFCEAPRRCRRWNTLPVIPVAENGESCLPENGGAQKVYTDLEQMAQDDTIDAVYIASPNSLHYEQSKLFLQNGKHVICEKPITVEPEQLEELQQLAQQKQLIYLEALIGVYLPQMQVLKRCGRATGQGASGKIDFSQYFLQISGISAGERSQTSLTRRWQPAV